VGGVQWERAEGSMRATSLTNKCADQEGKPSGWCQRDRKVRIKNRTGTKKPDEKESKIAERTRVGSPAKMLEGASGAKAAMGNQKNEVTTSRRNRYRQGRKRRNLPANTKNT